MNATAQDSNLNDTYSLDEFVSKNTFRNHPKNPLTPSEYDYVFRNRENNGFKEAFAKLNTRKYVTHIPTYVKCLHKMRGQ